MIGLSVTIMYEKERNGLVDLVTSRLHKNSYTQSDKRYEVDNGYSDCSSLMWWAYDKIGISIGDYTGEQIISTNLYDVKVSVINGVPDEEKMLKGDLLFFRSNSSTYPQKVGHVEMYVGNNMLCGHGSGVGPTLKNIESYCYNRAQLDKGLICVRRAVKFKNDKPTEKETTMIDTKTLPRINQKNKDYQSPRAVKVWQAIIGCDCDGRFGPDTEKATIEFEERNGIYDTPENVGPLAWEAGLKSLID